MKKHVTKQEARDAAYDQFFTATRSSENWMSVNFHVIDGRLVVSKTTFNFPFEDHRKAIGMLADLLEEDKKQASSMASAKFEPLPLADHLKEEEGPVLGPSEYQEDPPEEGGVSDE